jgi:hypothetical protein
MMREETMVLYDSDARNGDEGAARQKPLLTPLIGNRNPFCSHPPENPLSFDSEIFSCS